MPSASWKILSVQHALMRWFRVHQRDLPWRHTKQPYKILVSEIMLQQTQVDRVIPKYRAFLKRFPTVQALARATPRDVLLAWEGMGYNRRALYLRHAAQEIVAKHNGKVPGDPAVLQTLPGIGAYTAAAVATFSSGVPHALADVNVRRVVGRVMLGVSKQPWNESRLWRAIEQTTPRQNILGMESVWWGHAVMDFGALVCKAKPRCDTCPLQRQCEAYPYFERVRAQEGKRARGSVLSRARTLSRSDARPVPDRIYRGKILQLIRERDPRPLSLRAVSSVLTDISPAHLRRLIRGLQSDGLLAMAKRGAVSLPIGDAAGR